MGKLGRAAKEATFKAGLQEHARRAWFLLAHGLNLAPAALPGKKTWKEPRSIAFFADKARNIPGVQDLGPSAYFISLIPEQQWAAGLCGQEGLEEPSSASKKHSWLL